MKLVFPQQLARIIFAASVIAPSVPHLVAQTSTTLESWEETSRFDSVEPSAFGSWGQVLPYRGTQAITSDYFYLLPDGSSGSTKLTEGYINASGFFSDASGTALSEDSFVPHIVVTGEAIGSDNPKGMYMMGMGYYTTDLGEQKIGEDTLLLAGDYSVFSKENATQINVGLTNMLYTELEIVGGTANQDRGSSDAKASTDILLNNASGASLIGGNIHNSATAESSNYVGDTTLVMKAESYGTSVVGGNLITEGGATAQSQFTGSVRISLQENSQADRVVGGSSSEASVKAQFTGSTKEGEYAVSIAIRDSMASNIVGGNSGNAGDFTGNVSILHEGGLIDDSYLSIVGANYSSIVGDTSFTGNTNVTVKSLFSAADSFYGTTFGTDYSVIGGMGQSYDIGYSVSHDTYPNLSSFPTPNFEGYHSTLKGSTHVNIDLSETGRHPGSENYFGIAVVGGSMAQGGLTLRHEEGSANLSITGADGVYFTRWVVGGNIVTDSSQSDYVGYSGTVFEHIDRTVLASAYVGEVNVRVDSGNFATPAWRDRGILWAIASSSSQALSSQVGDISRRGRLMR